MNIIKTSLATLCFIATICSCNNDDDGPTIQPNLPRDRTEVQQEDIATIEGYLSTHYYNSTAFEALENPSTSDIEIGVLPFGVTEAPAGQTILINSSLIEKRFTRYQDTDYEYYVLTLNKGGSSKSPNFTDNVRVKFEGFTIDNTKSFVFNTIANSVDFDLVDDLTIVGWRRVLTTFNTAVSFDESTDGNITFKSPGLGIMFLPSGLAFFNARDNDIEEYTPVAFKFDLFQTFDNDHDNDGVLSHLEDLNSDQVFTAEDDDTDGDGTFNYLDLDDDGDGIPTINEDLNNDGNPANDIGDNNIPRYLDPTALEFVGN